MERTVEPGLVDLQVNGYAGYDVNADDVDVDTIAGLAEALWARGVTTFLPTVITASREKILHVLAVIASARRRDQLLAHSIAGIHVEGPSLASEDGPRGVHDAEYLRDPDLDELDEWRRVSDDAVCIVTVAPERSGSHQYIEGAIARGVHVSIGHSACTSNQVHGAIDAGARLSTHLGNGTHAVLPRHPNHIWAQLADDRLTTMLITDGHHLPADTATAMIRAKSPARCIITSDSAALAGKPPGRYTTPVGGHVDVESNGRLSLPGTDFLAGSGRSLRGCLDWARKNLPIDPVDLLAMASHQPARFLGVAERTAHGGDSVTLEDGQVIGVKLAGADIFHR